MLILSVGLFVVAVGLALFALLRPSAPKAVPLDACEVCQKPATHELAETVYEGQGGYSAMIACYCRKHAPDKAIKVA